MNLAHTGRVLAAAPLGMADSSGTDPLRDLDPYLKAK